MFAPVCGPQCAARSCPRLATGRHERVRRKAAQPPHRRAQLCTAGPRPVSLKRGAGLTAMKVACFGDRVGAKTRRGRRNRRDSRRFDGGGLVRASTRLSVGAGRAAALRRAVRPSLQRLDGSGCRCRQGLRGRLGAFAPGELSRRHTGPPCCATNPLDQPAPDGEHVGEADDRLPRRVGVSLARREQRFLSLRAGGSSSPLRGVHEGACQVRALRS